MKTIRWRVKWKSLYFVSLLLGKGWKVGGKSLSTHFHSVVRKGGFRKKPSCITLLIILLFICIKLVNSFHFKTLMLLFLTCAQSSSQSPCPHRQLFNEWNYHSCKIVKSLGPQRYKVDDVLFKTLENVSTSCIYVYIVIRSVAKSCGFTFCTHDFQI